MNHHVFDNSQCSSGCESGWTLYLEHSFLSPYPSLYKNGVFSQEKREKYHEDEDEDLSMVSDASSGPPHFQEDDGDSGCFYNNAPPNDSTLLLMNSRKKQRIKETSRKKVEEQHPSLLDDTASSPLFNFSNNNFAITKNQASMENVLDFSQGYSTTHFQGRSEFNGHLGFFQSSLSGNQLQQNQWCKGKRWG